MLTSEKLSTLRKALLDRQQEIDNDLHATDYFDTKRSFANDSTGELSHYDNHPADTATDLFEREKDIALVEHFEKELKDINHALARIEDGSYGKCETCQADIPVERLEALPTATHCLKHSPDQVVSHRRPVEEDVLGPPFGDLEYDEKDSTFYDSEDSWQDVEQYGTSETPSDFNDRSMLDYNGMYVEEDEPTSYVQEIDSFIATDIDGNNVRVYPNAVHEQYEERLDEEEVMSVVGNLGQAELEFDEDK
ncbi:TraR/DksA C4-type zinc finger protein [Bacillus sp. Marseille-P3661]|uniref:TraR/DksA C4-type zinc finger protein n=1 Tax=Bacillus sp. Marseille-P3661 TaxID=1936234 RepID=UPI000C84FDB0|nr:TraR/DksA C4-type zinc finger protein [Bacillus sp. Marseille-P3661]